MPLYNIRLIGRKIVSENTMAFQFEKPKGFDFIAGQFGDITLINPFETDAEGNTRGFSIASPPYADHLLIATRMRHTAFKRVLKEMPLGEIIKWDAPYGSFTLHNKITTPAVYLTGGIGITPVRSIALQAAKVRLPHQIFIFYSNNRPEDAVFLEELKSLENKNLNFKLIATMTNMENSQQSWEGETGYINHDMLTKYLNDLTIPIYYISGPPAMVAAMRKMLHSAGVDNDNIRTEEFSGYEPLAKEKEKGITEDVAPIGSEKPKQVTLNNKFDSGPIPPLVTPSNHHITLTWRRTTPDFFYKTYNRNAMLTFGGGKQVVVSNPPNYFGDASLANPEELLVSALSCCYMQTFLAVACKQGYVINQYTDQARGLSGRNEKGKKSVTEISLNPKIIFAERMPDKEMLHTMQKKAHDNCFISNSINAKVDINIIPSLADEQKLTHKQRYDWYPQDGSILEDQCRAYDEMREKCPVAHSEFMGWSLFRHQDITAVLNDPTTYSNKSQFLAIPNGIDPPFHEQYRKALAPYFVKEQLDWLEPLARNVAADLFIPINSGKEIEFASAFATPFSIKTLCTFLGWPEQQWECIGGWVHGNQQVAFSRDQATGEALAQLFSIHVKNNLEKYRATPIDENNVTGRLLRTEIDGVRLSDDQIVSILRNWAAGHGTVAAGLSILVFHLAQNLTLQNQLRGKPSLIPAAIEEILRVDDPLVANRRITTRDVEINGQAIPKGESLSLMWIAANRDPRVFNDPNTIDIERDAKQGLVWGQGIHFCLGAPLARLEMRIALEELLSRTNHFELLGSNQRRAAYPSNGFTQLFLQIHMKD